MLSTPILIAFAIVLVVLAFSGNRRRSRSGNFYGSQNLLPNNQLPIPQFGANPTGAQFPQIQNFQQMQQLAQQPYLPQDHEYVVAPGGLQIWNPQTRQWEENFKQTRWGALILSFLFGLFLFWILKPHLVNWI